MTLSATLGAGRVRAHISRMTQALILALSLALAAPAAAQVPPPPPRPGMPAIDYNRYLADQNRYETERLRAQAERREAFARQLESEARLRRLQVEAARPPEPVLPETARRLRPPEQERAARRSATDRRQATAAGVGQIDDWLDRPDR